MSENTNSPSKLGGLGSPGRKGGKKAPSKIKVAVRVRPLLPDEAKRGEST
jgi:hypothetical protein